MRRTLLALLLLGVPTLHAAGPKPCADTGESSSTRTITPAFGKSIGLAEVPKSFLRTAANGWSTSYVPRNQRPPDDLTVTAASVFRFGTKTFYLLTVRNETSIFSTACPRDWCAEFTWWPAAATFVADAARPPQVVPGDEWYLLTADGPILAATDAFTEGYVWEEDCRLRSLLDATTKEPVRPPANPSTSLPSHMLSTCAPSQNVACFDAHSVRVTDTAQRALKVVERDSKSASFGHGAAAEVVLNVQSTCATGKVLRARITSTSAYQVTFRNIHTNKTQQVAVTPKGATGATLPCD